LMALTPDLPKGRGNGFRLDFRGALRH